MSLSGPTTRSARCRRRLRAFGELAIELSCKRQCGRHAQLRAGGREHGILSRRCAVDGEGRPRERLGQFEI